MSLPETITFKRVFGCATIQKGQMGYDRKTRVRFRRHATGLVWFPVRKHICHFIQQSPDSLTFKQGAGLTPPQIAKTQAQTHGA